MIAGIQNSGDTTNDDRIGAIEQHIDTDDAQWLVDNYTDVVDDLARKNEVYRDEVEHRLAAALDAIAIANRETLDVTAEGTDIEDGVATTTAHPRILQEISIEDSRDDVDVDATTAKTAQTIHDVAALAARGQQHSGDWWTLMPVDDDTDEQITVEQIERLQREKWVDFEAFVNNHFVKNNDLERVFYAKTGDEDSFESHDAIFKAWEIDGRYLFKYGDVGNTEIDVLDDYEAVVERFEEKREPYVGNEDLVDWTVVESAE